MKSFLSLTFFSTLLLGLMLAGCQKKKGESSSAQTATKNASISHTDILIGAVFPTTGPIATFGQESVNGILLALEKINAKGSIHGRSIRVIFEDNRGEPAESANAVRKLIDVDKVHLIYGSVASSNTLAGAPIAQNAKTPMVSPSSTNEAVTKKGEYIFRTCFTDNFQGKVMANFAFGNLKKKKALIVTDIASDYSRGLAIIFKETFQGLGGSVVSGEYSYNQGDKDFLSLLRKIKRAAPDVIFLPGYYNEVGIILRQSKQMGLHIPFLGTDGWDSPKLHELAGAQAAEGHYVSSHFSSEDSNPAVQEFVREYRKKYSAIPGAMAGLGYDGMFLLADVLQRVGRGISREGIKEELARTKDFRGLTGSITIDEFRNAKKSAVVLKTTRTGFSFYSKVDP